MTKARKRRPPGDGGVYAYKTGQGERHYYKCVVKRPDGTKKTVVKRGFTSGEAARDAMQEALVDSRRGQFTDPSKRPLGGWLDEWADGLRLAPSTVASYRKNIRLHVKPYVGDVPLSELTSTRLTKLYRDLEASGRRDGKGERTGQPLAPRTVRYISTIVGAALSAAVDAEPQLLARNPAAKAKPPTAEQARAPEMHPWNAAQLAAFLAWSATNSVLHTAWWVLSMTGMRRGELLGLRWRDIDLEAGTIAVRRSAGLVRVKGQKGVITEGATKNKQSRVVDIDAITVALLRAWKASRGTLALALARDDALVFSDLEGHHLHPERFSRSFKTTLARCRKALGDGAPPSIRLHDLRHTHATLLLASREPVKVVSERIGHKSVTVTLTVYGNSRELHRMSEVWTVCRVRSLPESVLAGHATRCLAWVLASASR